MKKIFLMLLIVLPLGNTVFSEEDTQGKLLSQVRYVFPLKLPGEIIELKKILTPSGEIEIVSSSEEYNTIQKLRTLMRQEEEMARQHYGKLSGKMRGEYEFMSNQDSIEIEVMLSAPLTQSTLQRFELDTSSVRGGDYIGSYTFRCIAGKSNLAIMAFDEDVVEMVKYMPMEPLFGGDEHIDTFPRTTPERYTRASYMLPDSINDMPSWASGSGVICATSEHGIHSDYLDSLRVQYNNTTSGHIYDTNSVNHDNVEHSQMTFGCMARAATQGIWSHVQRRWPYIADSARLNNIETISESYGNYPDPLVIEMLRIDSLIYDGGINPVFCNPTANNGIQYIANWGCYNAVSVGGSEYFNELYYGITSQHDRTGYEFTFLDSYDNNRMKTDYRGTEPTLINARNPLPRSALYAGLYGARAVSDREMPHVVAPSIVSYRGLRDGILFSKFGLIQGIGGTSGAAPTVNGISACIISSNPTHMTNQPLNVKAALMLTAVNIDGGLWNTLEDGRDGCGQVAGYDACQYVHNLCSYLSCGDTAEYGMSYDTLKNTTPPYPVLRYYIQIPDPLPESRHLRVMVNWSSSVGYNSSGGLNGGDNVLSDLDLFLIDCATSRVIGASGSLDDNAEVIDVYPSWKLTPGGIYCVEVRVKYFDFPADPVADYIKYSVGWAWPLSYAGKKITGDISGEREYCLLNRNLQMSDCILKGGSTMKMSATNRIELTPGTKISEGSNFTARITRNEFQYLLENTNTRSESDYSGNLRNAHFRGGSLDCSKFSQRKGVYFNGTPTDYLLVDSAQIKQRPSPHTGLTAAFYMRWLPDSGWAGCILCATATGTAHEGYRIDIDGSGNLTFTVGNSSDYSFVTYDIDSEPFYRGKYPANKGWSFITAVWSAGEYMKLYVNGEEKNEETGSIVKTHSFPSDSIFIGRDWSGNYFQGSIDRFQLYSGALSDTTIKGLPNDWGWPGYQGESDRSQVQFTINGNGYIDLAVEFNDGYRYTNSITANDTTTSFPRWSTVDFDFLHNAGGVVDNVIIDGDTLGSISSRSYFVKDTGNGEINVYFNP